MFAGATREVVFSNPAVVRRIQEEFIPVALKAGLVNNPPPGIEGELYAEIARSKPAPQGICTVNSQGKVLAWALSFDDETSILRFLDHVAARFKEAPDAKNAVRAERFRTFPSRKLPDVEDTGRRIGFSEQHRHDRCPALPALAPGTLVGRILGRPVDDQGTPIAETIRQEQYLEARFEIGVAQQHQLALAARQADGESFSIPDAFARSVVRHAFLGQLDVHPLGDVPGSRNDRRRWQFQGQRIESGQPEVQRIRITGQSDVAGGQDNDGQRSSDGRLWEHHVALTWQGYADIKDDRIVQLALIATGDERLRWGTPRYQVLTGPRPTHLMAGHAINLQTPVRYGLLAEPCPAAEEFPPRTDPVQK